MHYRDARDPALRDQDRYVPRFGAGFRYRSGAWDQATTDDAPSAGVYIHEGSTLVAVLSSDTADSRLSKLRFELTPTGCGSMDLEVTSLPPGVTLGHATRVDVRLKGVRPPGQAARGWSPPIYSGYIQQVPSGGSTEWPRRYRAFGWYGLLDKLKVDRTFKNAQVWRIVDTLARDLETVSAGRLVYNSRRIEVGRLGSGSAFPVSEIRFSHVTYRAALTQLAGLAGGYEFGVDAQREIWFRPPVTEPASDSHLWVGPHVHTVTCTEDSTDLVNRLWIKSGKRQSAGDNYLPLPLDADGSESSQAVYGIREGEVTAPSVFDDVDAYRWGATELAEKSVPKKTISISEIAGVEHFRSDCSSPVRLTLGNGTSITVPVSKVVYSVDRGATCTLQLGETGATPGRISSELQAQQARAELLQQIAMTQV